MDDVEIFFQLLSEEDEKNENRYTRFLVLSGTQRLGQAFYNALPIEYRLRLNGTLYDPFHASGWGPIFKAIDFLTTAKH